MKAIHYLASVRVTAYRNRVLTGVLYHPWFGDVPFDSFVDLILRIKLQMTELMNAESERSPVKPMLADETCIAAFELQIPFQQNYSWQGVLTWQGKHPAEQNFRSVLELMMLVDCGLSGMEEGSGLEREKP